MKVRKCYINSTKKYFPVIALNENENSNLFLIST